MPSKVCSEHSSSPLSPKKHITLAFHMVSCRSAQQSYLGTLLSNLIDILPSPYPRSTPCFGRR